MSVERSFEATNAAAGNARRFVLGEVGDVPKPTFESIAVMISELATNAVLHARTEFRVCVERLPDSVRVEVIDSGGGFPEPQLQPSKDAPHGRGLFIVQHLADEWGVTETREGDEKIVWFRIAVAESSVLSSQ